MVASPPVNVTPLAGESCRLTVKSPTSGNELPLAVTETSNAPVCVDDDSGTLRLGTVIVIWFWASATPGSSAINIGAANVAAIPASQPAADDE